MKKTSLVMVVVIAGIIGLGAYLRWEMARNREKMREEIRHEVADAPLNLARDIAKLGKETLGGEIAVTGKSASVLRPSGPIALPSDKTNTAPANPIFGLLDVAVKTAQQLDRIALDITRLTDEEESTVGAEIDRMILMNTPATTDVNLQQRIDSLAKPLLGQRKRRAITYTVRVIESDEVNAFSIAGGYIYITSAFIEQFPSDVSIVMALAHETAHVELRHCVEKVQHMAVAKQIVGNLAELAQIGYSTLRSTYTKEQEFEADEYGFNMARTAKWPSAGLLEFYRDLESYERQQRQQTQPPPVDSTGPPPLQIRLLRYFDTHPSTHERLLRLEQVLARSVR